MSNSTTRFSDRVGDYIKYRPHYPKEVLILLREQAGLTSESIVADIGSGTGISTELFLGNGNRVYAVEPNQAMREKAEELLSGYTEREGGKGREEHGKKAGQDGRGERRGQEERTEQGEGTRQEEGTGKEVRRGQEDTEEAGRVGTFISVAGTAEATGLAGKSIDLIVAGQAFHWFDSEKARKEFARIGKTGAFVALIWNDRLVESDFEKEYEDLILEYAGDYRTVNHRNITDDYIGRFFYPRPFALSISPNEQLFDFEGLKGRLLSSSYIPKEPVERYEVMLAALRRLFEKHQSGGRVRVGYATKLYLGQL